MAARDRTARRPPTGRGPRGAGRPRLAREIALVLVLKFAALAVIWNLWFADRQDRLLDAAGVGAALTAPQRAAATGGAVHARP
jgi:hypothetical protein